SYDVNGVTLDVSARRAYADGEELSLSAKEYALLTVLVRESGSAVTRDDLMREVRGAERWGATKTLDSHIAWRRRRRGDDATDPRRITAVSGVGLRFETGAESRPVRQRVLQATILTVLLAVLMLGSPLGYSWLQHQRQTLSNQANMILD